MKNGYRSVIRFVGTILTVNPFRFLPLYLRRQLLGHPVKTLDRVRSLIDRFEMFTYRPVNGNYRDLQL